MLLLSGSFSSVINMLHLLEIQLVVHPALAFVNTCVSYANFNFKFSCNL